MTLIIPVSADMAWRRLATRKPPSFYHSVPTQRAAPYLIPQQTGRLTFQCLAGPDKFSEGRTSRLAHLWHCGVYAGNSLVTLNILLPLRGREHLAVAFACAWTYLAAFDGGAIIMVERN